MRIGTSLHVKGEMQPLIENVRMAAEAGFEVMNLSLFTMHRPGNPFYGDDWREAADTLRNAAEKYGIQFSQSHIPYRSLSVKFDVEMAKQPGGLEFFSDMSLRSVEISHIMGCKVGVIHPMDNPNAGFGDLEAQVEHNLRIFDREIEAAHKYNVGLAFENLYDLPKRRRFGVQAAELKLFIDRVNSPLVGACWDLGHANMGTSDQVDSILLLGDKITALHVHDNNGKDDLHMMPFTGTIAWERVMHAMYEGGCKADMMLELDVSRMPLSLQVDEMRLQRMACEHLVSLYK